MNPSSIFKEYIWLVNTIYRAGRISLREISQLWQQTDMSGGLPLSRSSFNRHKAAIEDIFGLYIECDVSDNFRYYIGNAHVLEEDTLQNWMLSTFSLSNALALNHTMLNGRIVMESVPSEGDTLLKVVDAMKQNLVVNIVYQKYSSSEVKEYRLEPYCVKLFHRRWYLLGKKAGTDDFRTLSLDRMQSLTVTIQHFKMDKHFDAERHYRACFGIVSGDGTELQRVVLRAMGIECHSMRDLPIHSSQREIAAVGNHADFELRLCPTLDFLGYLVSRGCMVKVLQPEWLAAAVCRMHEEAMKMYEESPTDSHSGGTAVSR